MIKKRFVFPNIFPGYIYISHHRDVFHTYRLYSFYAKTWISEVCHFWKNSARGWGGGLRLYLPDKYVMMNIMKCNECK